MKFKNCDIDFKPSLKSIEHKPVYTFFKAGMSFMFPIKEYKEIFIYLSVKVGESVWEIPYLILLTKFLK